MILTADHAEGMGEHEYYFAHGENLYDVLLRVPLIIRYGSELKGRRGDTVQLLDLFPTVLKFLDLKPRPNLRGRDLLTRHDRPPEVISEIYTPTGVNIYASSLIYNNMKIIHAPKQGRYLLFDLKSDPMEEKNLSGDSRFIRQQQELAAKLSRLTMEDRLQLEVEPTSVPLTEKEKRNMRSLGYIR
jgi:arylsulfatase A-like enzyme